MNTSNPGTLQNLEAAFGGESMANRKYLFFADLAKQLGHGELARLFRETAQQETEHAFAHFRLLHPELVVENPEALSQDAKDALLARCLELAIEAPSLGGVDDEHPQSDEDKAKHTEIGESDRMTLRFVKPD